LLAKSARIIASEVIPLLQKQAGFTDQVTLLSPGCTEAVFITFWDRQESEKAFDLMRNPEVAKSPLGLLEGAPEVGVFEVIDSTFFCITDESNEEQKDKRHVKRL
jgi:hypothetical protein